MKTIKIFPILGLFFISLACNLLTSTPTAVSTTAAAEVSVPTPPTLIAPTIQDETDPTLIQQWAVRSRLEPGYLDDVAIGAPEGSLACGEPWLADLPKESGEIILTLSYAKPLLPQQVNIFQNENPGGILRVELLNSASGLGKIVYESDQSIFPLALPDSPCAEVLSIPVQADFETDSILITFASMTAVSKLGAVELAGHFEAFSDLPVFWRVPLPGAPVSLAANTHGTLYVATESNGIYNYSVEGNQLKEFSVPMEAAISDLTSDPSGNLVLFDNVYQWFVVFSAEGEQLAAGGEGVVMQVAVSPLDGNVYLLGEDSIRVYTSDTTTILREMPIEAISYKSLAFDPAGYLYTIRQYEAVLLKLDPLSGEELDAMPLRRSSAYGDIEPRDLAIDEKGNFYVLFSTNTGQAAVHILDPQGNLLRRIGQLTYDPDDWEEGQFFEPRAIAVSSDGRFLFIADGYEDTVYLTAFNLFE
jgi:DNA-binding beta-propeller fold protein YncE